MERPRVLFLCTGNSARSILAEALLRHHAHDRVESYSAGLDPIGVREETLTALEEVGIDTSGLESTSVEEYLGNVHFSYLITVCSDAEEDCPRVWPGVNERIHWPVADPALVEGDGRMDAFRAARDELDARIRAWLAEESLGDGATP